MNFDTAMSQVAELIDTLWNVNLTIVPSFGDSAGN